MTDDLSLSFGEDLLLKATIEQLQSQLRVTLERSADRAVTPADAPKVLAEFLRRRADEYDPGPPAVDTQVGVDRVMAAAEAFEQATDDQVRFGAVAAKLLETTADAVTNDIAAVIEQDGTDALTARRQAATLVAGHLEVISTALRRT